MLSTETYDIPGIQQCALTVSVLVLLIRSRGGAPETHEKQELVGCVDEGVHRLRAHGARPTVQIRQKLRHRDHQVAGQG